MSETPWEIDCRSLHSQLKESGNLVLIDCREPDEYEIVNIAGAKLLPMSEIASRVDELEQYRNHAMVIHCHHGGRSLRVARWLRDQGFPQAQSLAGGIEQWAIEIDPSMSRY